MTCIRCLQLHLANKYKLAISPGWDEYDLKAIAAFCAKLVREKPNADFSKSVQQFLKERSNA